MAMPNHPRTPQPRRPQQRALVLALPTPTTARLPCDPAAHQGGGSCAVCAAWERGVALLPHGQQMARQRYVMLHEAKA
jgi:hypothetical protein